jgi:hypothetical protein
MKAVCDGLMIVWISSDNPSTVQLTDSCVLPHSWSRRGAVAMKFRLMQTDVIGRKRELEGQMARSAMPTSIDTGEAPLPFFEQWRLLAYETTPGFTTS